MANGLTDFEDYYGRMYRKCVGEWFRCHCFEEGEEVEEDVEEEEAIEEVKEEVAEVNGVG